MKPLFQHDCANCEYVGTTSGPDRDWYICNDTIIAREGDEGWDYWCSPISIVEENWGRPIGHFQSDPPRKSFTTMHLLAHSILEIHRRKA